MSTLVVSLIRNTKTAPKIKEKAKLLLALPFSLTILFRDSIIP